VEWKPVAADTSPQQYPAEQERHLVLAPPYTAHRPSAFHHGYSSDLPVLVDVTLTGQDLGCRT